MNEAAGESTRPPVKLVGAVVSALDIMRFLAQADEPLRLAQISRSLGLNNSTCFNILRTLELKGIVEFDRLSKLYRAGQGLVGLAMPLIEREDGRQRFRQAMEAAARELGATVALWRRVGDEMELVSVAESSETMRIAFTVGRRVPVFVGAMGRLMAARSGLDGAALKSGFERVPWAKPLDFSAWLEQVAAAGRAQVGRDNGHINRGILGLAVPVELDGPLTHVCCSTFFEDEHDEATVIRVINRLKDIATIARGAGFRA